ncbi:MAG: HNH endonuclease domain-containing protein [bacterium]
MSLPWSSILPIEILSSIFNNTTNSYKFYWFLSILEKLKTNPDKKLYIEDLAIEMICEVWYPLNFFKLSFGAQDQFPIAIKELQTKSNLPIETKKNDLFLRVKEVKDNQNIGRIINQLSRYVPYRFLSPWYFENLRRIQDSKKNNLIISLSNNNYNNEIKPSFYRFTDDGAIEINKLWKAYLLKHLRVLQGFTYWHLINYLQRNNPNVPNISDKLFPPEYRILVNAKKFWNSFFDVKKNFQCIYSGEILSKNNFSIDHFLPWSFVAHDQLWNLLPIPKSVNSSKGDNLPSEKYYDNFSSIQFDAFHIAVENKSITAKILEDYSILFNDNIRSIKKLDKRQFGIILINNIKPLIQIAANMGFKTNWYYKR